MLLSTTLTSIMETRTSGVQYQDSRKQKQPPITSKYLLIGNTTGVTSGAETGNFPKYLSG